MKKYFILICFIPAIAFSQSLSITFDKAMEAFKRGEFAQSHELFMEITSSNDVEDNLVATARYYSAESLLGLKMKDAAINELEYFADSYRLSNFRDEALYKLGTIYFDKRQYQRCIEKLLILLREFPESEFVGSAYYWIGEAYTAENKFLEAEEFLQEAISTREENKFIDYSIYSLANLYEKIGDFTSAVTYYDELLAYYKDSQLAPFAQFRIGVSYFNLKEYDSAVLELSDPIIKRLPEESRTEAEYVLANSFFRLKDYENASGMYTKILDKYQDEEDANKIKFGLAWVNFQMKNYDEAYRMFNVLARTAKDSIAVNSLFWSAECKRYSGGVDLALNVYQRLLDTYPDNKIAAMVNFKIGIIYYNKGETAQAERYLISSIVSEDEEAKAKAFSMLGEMSLINKDYQTAKNYFSSGIKLKKIARETYDRLLLGYGVSSYYMNEFNDAIATFEELDQDSPRFEKDKVNFYLAESYFAKGDFSSAMRHFNIVNFDNDEVGRQALYGKAYSHFNLKDYADAAYYFNEYIKRYPADVHILDSKLRLADSYYGTKNFVEASRLYQEVFERYSGLLNSDFAYYQFGQALFKSDKPYEAIEKFKILIDRFPQSKYADDSRYLIGWINFQQGNFRTAINNYVRILDEYTFSAIKPIALYSIGDGYFNLAEYDSAVTFYSKLIEEYPQTDYVFDAINGIQYSYVAKDEPQKAVKYIDQYIAAYPTSKLGDQILFKKGETYYSIGEYDYAKVAYKEFIATYPTSQLVADAYYWIGKSAENLNQTEDAIFNYKRVVDNYVNTEVGISSVIELGKIYSDRKQYLEAIELYNNSINLVSESNRVPELMYLKGLAQVQTGSIPEAYKTFNEVISFYDGNIFAAKSKIELGILELTRGSYETAGQLFSELGENRIDDIGAQAQYLYGVSLFDQNKIEQAIAAFVRVRSVFSTYDEWYTKSLLKLGDCYVKLNDRGKARDMYRAVLKRHNNDEYGREANSKLRKL
ncbi:MAG: tetratricopeptide repeat protein [Melioribacteraceae bacterium]|nr:tetratricopeptide repeat protein [Melioribacteraceae bacterium]MCF8354589.1 tetratricopeptide repeat protein [Melioribacteraceae bacterium]MCF8394941.1 tetratricopeptide repeat protein [Melioribacteraceae bacterium]MCF8420166.1 tetratricopeptide repeat protein [Melioribacteraceae bacterium]